MNPNPYQLGVAPSIDDVTEYRLNLTDSGQRWPRRIEDYWHVRDRSLNRDQEALERRILDAYKSDDAVYLDLRWFVTDDVDLFVEMYRHLSIDFVADFASNLFFMDMFAGHEALMTQLFDLTGKKPPRGKDAAEAYVLNGLGMFKSSQTPWVNIGPEVAVPDYFRPFKHRLERME